jgi:cell wall-associated NlpC family hydrolase
MPSRLLILLPALALLAVAFGWEDAAPESGRQRALPAVVHHAPPVSHRRRRVAPKPTLGERAARIAVQAVGVPYRWGGASPASGFDCSGLVYWAYRHLGVELPHSSYALYDLGRHVPRTRLKAGDLVFFYGLGHVGIYLGRNRMVHAPSSGKRVEIVTLHGSHYGSRLVGARRVMRAI